MNINRTKLLLAISLVILAGVVWVTRPIWHWLFMGLYVNPAIWEPIVVAIVLLTIVGIIGKKKVAKGEIFLIEHKKWMVECALVLLVIFWAVLCPFQVMYPQCQLAQSLKVSNIEELPDIDTSAIRVMPMAVSQRYAKDSLQYPRFRLGTEDIAFINSTPCWTYPLVPDGAINFFILKDKGAAYVDMSTSEKNTKIIEKDMEIGEGMGVTDWYRWQLYTEKYWVNYEDPYFIPTENELYIAVPIITYEYQFRFPTLYTVPWWGGIALISPAGEIEFLTPEEALGHPVLNNQKLFPEELTRYYVDSFRYEHGIINRLFYHQEQLEIAEVGKTTGTQRGRNIQRNEQPFLVMTDKGMEWFVACEPFGGAHGIFRIYLVDARNGKIQVKKELKNETLTGPVRACDYVRKENPIVDWNRMFPVEPIPVPIEGKLYWQVRVIPTDCAGIAYTAFVDSKTNKVFEVKTDKEIENFIEGKYLKPEIVRPEITKNITAIVVIRENGQEIQRIELLPNQTVELVPLS